MGIAGLGAEAAPWSAGFEVPDCPLPLPNALVAPPVLDVPPPKSGFVFDVAEVFPPPKRLPPPKIFPPVAPDDVVLVVLPLPNMP